LQSDSQIEGVFFFAGFSPFARELLDNPRKKKTKKNFQKHLVVIKKSFTFAPAFETKRFKKTKRSLKN